MEEKKQKYILQQQLAQKSTTLSLHRANLIKAKLGLVVSNSSSSSQNRPSSSDVSHRQQASTNSVLTLDPSLDGEQAAGSAASSVERNGLIGAPLNSIPKTDFECTDKRGKFVSGLFADHKTGCQVWHLCSNNRKYSFLCPSGTIFNAKLRICDWRYNVKCESSAPFWDEHRVLIKPTDLFDPHDVINLLYSVSHTKTPTWSCVYLTDRCWPPFHCIRHLLLLSIVIYRRCFGEISSLTRQ